jgi:hypothetical protein
MRSWDFRGWRVKDLDQIFFFHGHGVEEVTEEFVGVLLTVL